MYESYIINIKGRIVDKDKFLNYQDLFPFHEEKKFYVPRVYHRFYKSIIDHMQKTVAYSKANKQSIKIL